MNEEELVYQLKQESQDAFNRIYNMYSARLYAYCMQYVKSREDTEEIVQDVFIKLWINRHSIIHGELLSAFIFKIAKNQIINRYKSRINSYVFEEYVNYKTKKTVDGHSFEQIIYTGPIDEFFNYQLGFLEYRSLKFETIDLDNTDNYQGNAVTN